ncbi:hypothetical protein N7490_009047 [Penicillium lividum]|nr:hypothetical protein N7490_009047 [Penicillium lividum]
MSLAVDRNSVDFLEHDDHDRLLENEKDNRRQYWRPARWWLIPVSIHLAIFTVQLWFLIWPSLSHTTPPSTPMMKWQDQIIDSTVYHPSPYSGNPSPDIDHAWNQLTSGFNLRVPKSTLDRLNRTSIPLSDGSGYIAGWDATHQLHCLLSIRHALAPEYYATEMASMYKPENEVYPTHISHCIELLRKQIMCKAEGSLFTYEWSPTQHAPMTNFAVEHKCVDWDSMYEWSIENSFPLHENLLIHPTLGPWPNGGPV